MRRRAARLAGPAALLIVAVAGAGCAGRGQPSAIVTPPPDPAPVAVTAAPDPAPPPIATCRPHELQAAFSARREALLAGGRRVRPDEVGYYMDVQQARLQQVGSAWLAVARAGHTVRLNLPGRWSFAVGSADLSDAAEGALGRIAAVLADYRLSVITVHGHTDDTGDPAFNLALSERRALAVARHLVASGIAVDRILVVGHGSASPVASNASETGREENRRVELQVDPLV